MSRLPRPILADLERHRIEVAYIDRNLVRYWNGKRALREPIMFAGWYWTQGLREGGPFRTRSAALRDAWFYIVQGAAPPAVLRNLR